MKTLFSATTGHGLMMRTTLGHFFYNTAPEMTGVSAGQRKKNRHFFKPEEIRVLKVAPPNRRR